MLKKVEVYNKRNILIANPKAIIKIYKWKVLQPLFFLWTINSIYSVLYRQPKKSYKMIKEGKNRFPPLLSVVHLILANISLFHYSNWVTFHYIYSISIRQWRFSNTEAQLIPMVSIELIGMTEQYSFILDSCEFFKIPSHWI